MLPKKYNMKFQLETDMYKFLFLIHFLTTTIFGY